MMQKGDTSAQHSKEAHRALRNAKDSLKRQAGGLGVKWVTNAPRQHGDIMVYFCVLPLA